MPIRRFAVQVSYPFHDAPDEHVKVGSLHCNQLCIGLVGLAL